jgi:hypothetical protein
MTLTEQEVLSDAGELVAELVTALSAEDLSLEEQSQALREAERIFTRAASILEQMLADKLSSKGNTIH